MNTVPKTIKIGGKTAEVRVESVVNGSAAAFGWAGFHDMQIIVRSNILPCHQRETLLHEMLHMIDAERDIDLSEHQVDQVAAGLYALMVDNPTIFGPAFMELFEAGEGQQKGE